MYNVRVNRDDLEEVMKYLDKYCHTSIDVMIGQNAGGHLEVKVTNKYDEVVVITLYEVVKDGPARLPTIQTTNRLKHILDD